MLRLRWSLPKRYFETLYLENPRQFELAMTRATADLRHEGILEKVTISSLLDDLDIQRIAAMRATQNAAE